MKAVFNFTLIEVAALRKKSTYIYLSALDMTHGRLSRILRIDYAGNS
jgi:hypothetical protein